MEIKVNLGYKYRLYPRARRTFKALNVHFQSSLQYLFEFAAGKLGSK